MNTIVLASNNKNKLYEMKSIMLPFNLEVKTLSDLNLPDPVEDGKDFTENALIKARSAFKKTGLPTISDDSGFCIDTLNNFPGLASKRFMEAVGDYDKAAFVLNNCLSSNNKAHFTTCIAFVFEKDNKLIEKTFLGNLNGNFIYPGRGQNGFGYCPYFIPDGYSETLAEISDEHRIKINHRAIALERFVEFFKNNF